MTIEDVQHLLRNSVPDSATIFVDSSKRDRVHYPTPSEYVVDLLEPVRNVYGVDVLDAAIANCMYNVDYNNKAIRVIGMNTDACSAIGAARAAVVAAQPYGGALLTAEDTDELWDRADVAVLNSKLFAMGFASPLRSWLAEPKGGAYAVCLLDLDTAMFASVLARPSPPASEAELRVDADATGTSSFVVVETRIASIAMMCTTSAAVRGQTGWAAFNGAFYRVPDAYAPAIAPSAAPGGFAIEPTMTTASMLSANAMSAAASLYDIVTYEVVRVTSAQLASLASAVPTLLQFMFSTVTIEPGNYAGFGQLQSSLQEAFSASPVTNGITVGATSTSGVGKQAILRFEAARNNRFLFSTADSTGASVIGFDLETSVAVNTLARSGRRFGAVHVGGQPVPLYCSVLRARGQSMDSPGLANLLGPRYISLRCPEIEQYICTTGKYGPFSVGIGVFKLASTNEVAQVRFDYVSLVHKPFHPIGKLQRFTLRFELSDGTLYDFKGINNQLLLSFKYYTPTPQAASAGHADVVSTLNPDYDPDYLAYMVRQTGFAPRLDDPGYDPYDEDDEDGDDDSSSDGDEGDLAVRRFGVGMQRRVLDVERGIR